MHTTTTRPSVRVLLVVSQDIYRRGITHSLVTQSAIDAVAQAATVAAAETLVGLLQPDVVLLAAQLSDGSGVALCRRHQLTSPATRWLFLTADGGGVGPVGNRAGGVAGYLHEDVRSAELVAAVLGVAAGATWSSVRDGVPTTTPSELELLVTSLTPREVAVLRLITEGLTNRQIGGALFLSEKTVKNYVSGVLAKLGVQRRTQAAVFGAGARAELAAAS